MVIAVLSKTGTGALRRARYGRQRSSTRSMGSRRVYKDAGHSCRRSALATMLLATFVSLGCVAAVSATALFDRNLAYSSPFTNAPHVRLMINTDLCVEYVLTRDHDRFAAVSRHTFPSGQACTVCQETAAARRYDKLRWVQRRPLSHLLWWGF